MTRHPAQPRHTRREDRPDVEATGKRFHAARLAYLYEEYPMSEDAARLAEYQVAMAACAQANAVYAVGRRKASVEYCQKHGAKSKGGK